MKRRRIAIVGAGFSGAVLAAHLLRRGRTAPDVVLIEKGGRFGPGLAYGVREGAHLLNVRAARMSAVNEAADDFADWLRTKRAGDARSFAPRMLYGAYLQANLGRAAGNPLLSRLQRLRGEAVAMRLTEGGVEISLRSGRVIAADTAVLALGNPPARTPPVLAEVQVIDAWDSSALKRIPASADVLLVGSGLTMVDVVLSLEAQRRTGVIYALSRRGLMSRAHAETVASDFAPIKLAPALSEALHGFRREVKAMAARGEPWQHAFDRLRKDTPFYWARLPLEAQQRFLRHLRPWWDVHRHRAAPDVAARIAALQAAGKLKLLAGEIVSATREGRTVLIAHRQRGSLVRHKFDVRSIVNCTGADLNFAEHASGLAAQLQADGLARPAANGLGLDVDRDGRVIDAAGAAAENLYALGPITQGVFWEATAVPEIRARAAALAELL